MSSGMRDAALILHRLGAGATVQELARLLGLEPALLNGCYTTWSTPVKVNQTPVSVVAFTPSVSVLPNGTVGVAYYDIRNDTGNPSSLLTDYFFADSPTGTAPWSERRVTTSSFDDTFAPISRGYFLGNYQGLANDRTNFKSFFVQTNPDPSNRTDVFASTITP